MIGDSSCWSAMPKHLNSASRMVTLTVRLHHYKHDVVPTCIAGSSSALCAAVYAVVAGVVRLLQLHAVVMLYRPLLLRL